MIEVKNLNKTFGDRQVLFDVSATFRPGITNMIIGGSGTGKSVLLKNIVGLVVPDSGQVLFNGRDFHHADKEEKKQIRREIGMLFQSAALFDSLSVEQNVRFPLDMLSQMPDDEKADRVNFCLQRVGLENANQKRPSELSGGMKKRVGIARAIALQTNYLFCDEPNSGLDPLTSIMIDNLIQEITQEYNITTVVVSHDMNSVMEIGENIIFMYKGAKLWEGDNETIFTSDVKELNEFIFSNKLMRRFQPNNGRH
ncbi:MAG: ATP-binding cassette domain-containing protein [Bernardetiaceae bacterium]|jgi:phospholipid/cholesterol/gamma-HCH transport system ATP-binding protein|nr:ATP-binding cassette domain-containing protein [Bernardetiaceae bacterium]